MDIFMVKWEDKIVEDWGTTNSFESKEFVKDFIKMLKRHLDKEGCNINIKLNHYDLSGFIEKDGKYIYISYSIPRGFKIDFNASGAMDGVLYRAADNDHDYKGYYNNFSSLADIPRKILEMFDNYERYNKGRV